MVEPKKLVPGPEAKKSTPAEYQERIKVLRATVEKYLPEFVQAVKTATDVIVLHQDACASGYHDDEYVLLGMAIKYAGLHDKPVTIVGRNHDTF